MTGEYAVSFYAAVAIGGILVIGYFTPPLTPRDTWDLAPQQTETVQNVQAAQQQFAYCQNNLQDVDCACFAGKAGHVMSYDGPEIPGVRHASRSQLAHGQAIGTCD